MKLFLTIFIIGLSLVNPSNALAECNDLQVLVNAAQAALVDYETSTPEDDCLMCGYLSVDVPVLEKSNVKGADLWNVPVYGDGEGCYGDIAVKVETGTCSIIETPFFAGATCSDE